MAGGDGEGFSFTAAGTVVVVMAVAVAGLVLGRGTQASDAPTESSGPQWTVLEHTDPMTDQRMLGATLLTESGEQALALQCEGDSADELLIAVRDPLAMYMPNPFGPDRLTYRFDSETPVEVDAIVNGDFLFIDSLNDRAAFLARLTKPAQRLLVRYETTSGRLADYAFALPETHGAAVSTAALCAVDMSASSTTVDHRP